MFERPAKGSGASTRAKALLVLLGVTALGAYYVGRQSSHIGNAPVAAQQPMAFAASVSPPIAAAVTSSVNSNPAPTVRAQPAALHAPKNLHRQRFPSGGKGK